VEFVPTSPMTRLNYIRCSRFPVRIRAAGGPPADLPGVPRASEGHGCILGGDEFADEDAEGPAAESEGDPNIECIGEILRRLNVD